MPTPDDAVRAEGYAAYGNGARITDNPYEWASTSSARMWENGWLEAERVVTAVDQTDTRPSETDTHPAKNIPNPLIY